MQIQISEKIESFFDYFRRLLNGVSSTKFEFSPFVCQSILLCSMLDTLSKCVYDYLPNNVRFICFVDDFTGWKCKDRISLIQLFYFMQKENHLKYNETKAFLNDRFSGLTPDVIYKASRDLLLSDIPHPKVIEEEIRQFTYSNLLYKFRNSVVHEFKTLGDGMDFGEISEAYYHSLSHLDVDDNNTIIEKITWELVFPTKYLATLVSQSIDNLQAYCIANKINPYEHYYFENTWLSSKEVKKNAKQ